MARPRKTPDESTRKTELKPSEQARPRRLMVTEDTYQMLQDIALAGSLSGAGVAVDRLVARFGELFREEQETLKEPYKPSNRTRPNTKVTQPLDNTVLEFPQQLANRKPTEGEPKERTNETKERTNETNPLTDLLKGFG